MYNQYLKVKPSKWGVGVFTSVEIPANVPIIEVTGQVYTEDKLPDPNDPALIQVGPYIYIGPSGTIDDYIGHSCNPNCLLHIGGKRAIVYSMYVIKAGSEITFDYSTSSTDTLDKWQMNCQCGEYNCRKVISGLHYLDEATQTKYKEKGMIPIFLTHPIFLKKY